MTTWLITGCSTGLGRALAQAVLARGDNVAVTARDVSTVADLAEAYPDTALPLTLDVTDAEQVAQAVAAAVGHFGNIDVLVNNAGYGYRAAVEEGDDGQVRQLFETHFFGTVAIIKAVLPRMRAQRSGTIVNISSIGARISSEGAGYYAAAKAAVESLTTSLRKELAPLGINAFVVEPSGFRTDFAGRSLQRSDIGIDDYANTAAKRHRELLTTQGHQPGDPAKAAAALIQVVESGNPPYLLLLGNDAVDMFRASQRLLHADVDNYEQLSRGADFTPE